MKTLFKIGVLTIICMLLFQPVNGQKLLKKITDKAKQKVEQRIEKKVDDNDNKTSEGEFITHLNPNSKSMAYQVVSGDMAKQGQGMFII